MQGRGSDTRSDIEGAQTARIRRQKLPNIREREIGAKPALGTVEIGRVGASAIAETVGIRIALSRDVFTPIHKNDIAGSDTMATMAAGSGRIETWDAAGRAQARLGLAIIRITIGVMFLWVFFENKGKGLYTAAGYSGLINYYLKMSKAPAA